MRLTTEKAVRAAVRKAVDSAAVVDMHTHLFEPRFGGMLLWGIDELLTYHYLVAEVFRARPELTCAEFWQMPKPAQAELIWDELFVKRSPVSEACRGVVTCIEALGVKPGPKALAETRKLLARRSPEEHVDAVFRLAGVTRAVMTNDPFDDAEREMWLAGKGPRDDRFVPALRIDALFGEWPAVAKKLAAMGYKGGGDAAGPDARGIFEVKRFLGDWADRMKPAYLAASLPPDLDYPESNSRGRVMAECVLPFARERKLPAAFMIGVRKLVNPELKLAGDSLGLSKVEAVERLCRDWPDVRFFITLLARENQHALCIAARKFRNLTPFGCWWFLNDPSIIREMTAERLELLGLSMIPQHSDARVLDQLIYKWTHSRMVIGEVLADKYADLLAAGWVVTSEQVRSDVDRLFSQNFLELAGLKA
ncbi:MAG TPA: glucuronate isomerase [Planctomycetota bacterium]|nr:glucuronate isomerase [Planctomycetota bacterium]